MQLQNVERYLQKNLGKLTLTLRLPQQVCFKQSFLQPSQKFLMFLFLSSLLSSTAQQRTVTLPELIRFKTTTGKLTEQIGTHYRELGYLLLNDKKGEVTRTIIKTCGPDATDIILEIFRQWIEGKGVPVEWATLVEVLKDLGLTQLALEMEVKILGKWLQANKQKCSCTMQSC